jgi:hypothetical protein
MISSISSCNVLNAPHAGRNRKVMVVARDGAKQTPARINDRVVEVATRGATTLGEITAPTPAFSTVTSTFSAFPALDAAKHSFGVFPPHLLWAPDSTTHPLLLTMAAAQ